MITDHYSHASVPVKRTTEPTTILNPTSDRCLDSEDADVDPLAVAGADSAAGVLPPAAGAVVAAHLPEAGVSTIW